MNQLSDQQPVSLIYMSLFMGFKTTNDTNNGENEEMGNAYGAAVLR